MKPDTKGARETMRNLVQTLFLAGLVVLAALPAVAQGNDPVAVLKSDASLEQKEEACRQLSIKGTVETVPLLAELLTDEKLSHMARYALEPMPYPEAGQALRDALGKTSGRLKVGVVNSLAIRKDAQAVPELAKLLADADVAVAQASAVALGDIATPEAENALKAAIAQANVPQGNLNALCDGLLACAESHATKKESDAAMALFDQVLQTPNAPSQVRTAALRGAVLTCGSEKGLPLVLERLRGENTDDFFGALRVARELSGQPGVAAALAGALTNLQPDRKVLVLKSFREGDADAAGTGVLAESAQGPVEVRVEAVRALTRMQYSPALESISKLAWTDDGDLGKAARDSLAYFPGKDGDAALEALLTNSDPKARRVAVELVGQGGLDAPGPVLLKAAQSDADESVRVAALEGLHNHAGIAELQGLLDKLLQASSETEARAAERALIAVCEREKQAPGTIVVQKAVYGNLPDGPSVDVLERVAHTVEAGSPSITASNVNFGDPAPGSVKKLRVDYTENGAPVSKTVDENETLLFAAGSAPAPIVDAYCAAFDRAQGDAKLAVLRLLGATGSPKAFEIVRTNATSGEGALKDTALRTLCNWPTPDALPTLLELAKNAPDEAVKTLALGGTVRLLGAGAVSHAEALTQYASLLDQARTPEEKKLVLSGVAQVPNDDAFALALSRMKDDAVKAEAVQAALGIAKALGNSPKTDKTVFNGTDLTGWQGSSKLWRVEDGAIVGQSTEPVTQNEFLWSDANVSDFYLVVDVMLEPNTGNAGVQFRSKKIDERGQAVGYQADMGQDVWGRLYHEHGRGKLDWNDTAEKAVKPGEWNRYEILAIGPAIWTALNGTLGVAYVDPNGTDERSGPIAFQLHAGPPQTVRYKIVRLVRNPKLELQGKTAQDLLAALRFPQQ
jgi:HEAT repeat protein